MRTIETIAAILATLILTVVVGCGQGTAADPVATDAPVPQKPSAPPTGELVLAGGCFWCMEAVFEQLSGVSDVVSGYAGGSKETADYGTVSAGLTHHAESVRIRYDPQVISQETLLKVFFTAAHDPTQINRQYPDIGRQYRSTVFYTDEAQKQAVEKMVADLDASGEFPKPIATTLEPLKEFYPAEDYHQDYVQHNPDDLYVIAHSLPKIASVRKAFPNLIRTKLIHTEQ